MSGDGHTRILVVDDVPENLRLLEAVLPAHGYDVVSATDGRSAPSSPRIRTSCSSMIRLAKPKDALPRAMPPSPRLAPLGATRLRSARRYRAPQGSILNRRHGVNSQPTLTDATSHELRDTINVSLIGLLLGRQVTRLRPEPGHSTSRTNF
jgi:hypothetical protein